MAVVSEVNLMESPPDKVVLVGDVGVGKTSLFMRFATGQFVEDTTAMHNPKEARLGEFHKEWTIDGEVVSMTMYDTAGIERHMSTIPQTYFRWSKVIILVYSIDDSDTFDSLINWTDNISARSAERAQSDIIRVLVGNKLDLEDERAVPMARDQMFAENNDIDPDMVFIVSAKDGTGVQEMLNKIALKMKPGGRTKEPVEQTKKCKCC